MLDARYKSGGSVTKKERENGYKGIFGILEFLLYQILMHIVGR